MAYQKEQANHDVAIARADCSGEQNLCRDEFCRTKAKGSEENRDPHQKCEFPFRHDGKWIDKCFKTNHDDNYYCPTQKTNQESMIEISSNKWGICADSCSKYVDTLSMTKKEQSYCKNHYRTENKLENAIEACNKDNNCSLFYNSPCNDEGPFQLCQNESYLKRAKNDSCTYAKIEKKKIQKRIPVPNHGKCDPGLPDNTTCHDCERYSNSHKGGPESDGYRCVWVLEMGKCYHKQWAIHQKRDEKLKNWEIDFNCAGQCLSNPCLNGGSCFLTDYNGYSCTCPKQCYGQNCENCAYNSIRYKLDLEEPVLMFFQKGSKSGRPYLGPRNLPDLKAFVVDQSTDGVALIKNESDLLLEAGCKEKEWINKKRYQWIASGTLLEKGACVTKNYRNFMSPQEGGTIVNTTIVYERIREVNAKKQAISIDMVLKLRWFDPNIRTKYAEKIRNEGSISLRSKKLDIIWIPDLYIWNMTSVKPKSEWALLKRSRILPTRRKMSEEKEYHGAYVELRYEVKTTIYCKFKYDFYPMDKQDCSIRIGGDSDQAIFVLHDEKNNHEPTTYTAVGLIMGITFFGEISDGGKQSVGFNVRMNRLISPYMMKYYIPCIAIVLVSEIGFLVPLSAIPGRVALLVTQFLTLINLFIFQLRESPSDSELNELGAYLLVSLGFVVGAMVEFALVLLVSRRPDLKIGFKNKTIDEEKKEIRSCWGETSASKVYPKEAEIESYERKSTWTWPLVNKVDFIAFWVHLALFLSYNLGYWIDSQI